MCGFSISRRWELIKAIVFDFDGLILDTETPEFDTWQEVFESYGVKLERRTWDLSIGRDSKDFDIYKHLTDLAGQHIEQEVVRPKMRGRYLERIDENPILPGVEDYLASAKDMGLRLAVASSSSPGWAVGHLEQRKLLHYFEFVLSHGDVTNGKPDPELYTMSLARLRVRPQNAFAIEDSVNGLTAAKAAGLQCVVVPNTMTRGMDFGLADIRLESLDAMPLAKLIEELELVRAGKSEVLSKAKV